MADFTIPTGAALAPAQALAQELYQFAPRDPKIYQGSDQPPAGTASADDLVRASLEAALVEATKRRQTIEGQMKNAIPPDLMKGMNRAQRAGFESGWFGVDAKGKAPKGPGNIPADIRKRLLDTSAGQDQLTQLEQRLSDPAVQSLMGPVESRLMALPNALGLTPERAKVIAMIDQTRQVVGKAMEGGVLRKEDEEKYKRILPTVNDRPDVAMQKIAQVRQMLDMAYQRAYASGAGGNFNTGGLSEPEQMKNYLIDSGELEIEP